MNVELSGYEGRKSCPLGRGLKSSRELVLLEVSTPHTRGDQHTLTIVGLKVSEGGNLGVAIRYSVQSLLSGGSMRL